MTSLNSPLQGLGLSRRVYPFLGLAIVGMVTIRGLGGVMTSPELAAAVVVGALLVLAPLAPIQLLPSGRLVASIPVALGFGISSAEQARQAADAGADGVIVGTRLVRAARQSAEAVGEAVGELAAGLA